MPIISTVPVVALVAEVVGDEDGTGLLGQRQGGVSPGLLKRTTYARPLVPLCQVAVLLLAQLSDEAEAEAHHRRLSAWRR